jgi:hypothetical protein
LESAPRFEEFLQGDSSRRQKKEQDFAPKKLILFDD